MKKLIGILNLILLMGVISASAQCCDGAKAENSTNSNVKCNDTPDGSKLHVYYFHATRRCETCQAVETVTEETIKENYGTKVVFESINLEKDSDNPLLKTYNISGQTLLVVSENKKVDLTNTAFLNARSNPKKFRKKLKSAIDSML